MMHLMLTALHIGMVGYCAKVLYETEQYSVKLLSWVAGPLNFVAAVVQIATAIAVFSK